MQLCSDRDLPYNVLGNLVRITQLHQRVRFTLSSSTDQETEFSNDNLNITVVRQPGCRYQLDITIKPRAAKVAYAKAVKEVSKEVSFPGFRRGKAPESIILQKFGTQVNSEWENILINTAVSEAFSLTNLYPAMDNDRRPIYLKTLSMKASKEENSHVKIEFEAHASLPTIDSSLLHVMELPQEKVSAEKCQDRLNELLLTRAEWEELTGKQIEEGDFVDVSFSDPESDKEESSKESTETTRYCVSKGKIPESYYNELIGKRIGDSFVYTDEENGTVRTTVQSIKKAILPEANDEFAKSFGAPDFETLKSRIEDSLNLEETNKNGEKIRSDLIQQLLEKFPMDLPESVVKKHQKSIAARTFDNLKNVMPESSDEERTTAVKQLDQMIEERSRQVTHLRFLIHALARENNISIDDQEFEEGMKEVYYRSQTGSGPYMDFSNDLPEIQSEVFNQLMTHKVLSFLMDKLAKRS